MNDEGLTDFDCANIGAILGGHGDWFQAQLMRLVAKADRGNRARLARGFPETVGIVEGWLGQRTPDAVA